MQVTSDLAPDTARRSAEVVQDAPSPRLRTLVFLLLASLYVSLCLALRWAEVPPLAALDSAWLGGAEPGPGEVFARWLVALVPVLAASACVYFLLTRASVLTHRRVAACLLFAALACAEIVGLLAEHNADSLALSDYWGLLLRMAAHAGSLLVCALLAGPEASAIVAGVLDGPMSKTFLGKLCRRLLGAGPIASSPEWDTCAARRHRLFVFMLLAGAWVSYNVIFRWVEYPLFRADDWYYFGLAGPPWYELVYRWLLTLLPIVAWGFAIFFLLTRWRYLTHRRVALVLILGGLAFFEADMRWFQMSRKHVTLTEIKVFLTVDASMDLGLRPNDYVDYYTLLAKHAAALLACLFLAGPELRAALAGMFSGPLGCSITGRAARALISGAAKVAHWTRVAPAIGRLDSRLAFCLVAVLVLADPVIIWALDQRQPDLEESNSVVRELAETNPLRFQSLDRAWEEIVLPFSERSQDIKAANAALAEMDPATAPVNERLCVAGRAPPAQLDNVLVIQVESLSASVFAETDMPFVREFAKKCVKLNRHFSAANSTHYGVLGLLYGNPVTFYCGAISNPVPCPYLGHFADNGYSTRLLSMKIMNHHYIGDYMCNWTEPVFEAGNDWSVIPAFHREFEKPGPRFAYLFYNCSHYPYRYDPAYRKYEPEVPEDFNYSRSDLVLYREPILNRYKNALREFDDWLRHVLEKVDLTKTIVVVTGDHGEEILEQGRLGHCSSLNVYQTMTPCLVYVPGVQPAEVSFPTSHCDLLPTISDALGLKDPPQVMGRSIFQPVPFRYAVAASFEYRRPIRYAVITEDRKSIVERSPINEMSIVSLVDGNGRNLPFRGQPERWRDNFRIVRELEAQLIARWGREINPIAGR